MQEQQYIDHFRIERTLGSGAQGIVYLGVDERLERRVAIKTLKDNAAGALDQQALAREAKAVSGLQHRNIVALYDIGTWKGNSYLVFEHVDGDTLHARIRQGAMPVHAALTAACDILDGLAHAHRAGIVHRDIKPSNIAFDAQGSARLMDFGIARLAPGETPADPGAGTRCYLAPEIIAGGDATPLSDVYAVGVVLFEMLTGRLPAASDAAAAPGDSAGGGAQCAPPSSLRPELDATLDGIVLRALAERPADRFAAAAEMSASIRAFLDEPQPAQPDAGHPPAFGYLLRKLQRNKDFPAFAEHISEINQLTSPDSDTTIVELTNAILKDYSLTHKLLRLVNSSMYCQFGGKVTTVSRAITIIGFENVRMLAVGLLLFDHVRKRPKAREYVEANLWSFVCAGVARGLAPRNVDREQTFIAALLARFGKLLTIYYLPDEYDEICCLMQHKGVDQNAASRIVMGLGMDTLGRQVAEHLHFPALLVESMRPPEEEKPKAPRDSEQASVQIACFAAQLVDIYQGPDSEREAALHGLLQRYREVFDLEEAAVRTLVDDGLRGALDLIEVPVQWRRDIEAKLRPVPAEPADDAPSPGAEAEEAAAENTRESRSDGLLLGINEITNMLVAGEALNDVLGTILEIAYRVLEVQRVVMFVNDMRAHKVAARFGMGAVDEGLLKKLQFSLSERNPVHHAVERGQDLLIAESLTVRDRMPDWYRKHARAASCALLPIRLNEKLIGMIYADAEEAHGIDAEAFRHLKTLRNQAALAVRAQRAR